MDEFAWEHHKENFQAREGGYKRECLMSVGAQPLQSDLKAQHK